jgi:spermidine synthase
MNPTFVRILLGMTMFFTGAAGLVNEYVLSTVSTYILGNSIEQFSITIALMLGAMGLGGWIQRFISDDNLIEKFFYLEIALSILGGFSPLAIYFGFAFMEDHFALIQYFFIISIGFMIGIEIPFIARINEKFSETLKSNLSLIMGADYIGSLVGAFVWVYVLLPHFPLTKISFIISGVNVFVAIITYMYLKQKVIKPFIISLFVGTTLILGYTMSDKITENLEQKLYQDPIIYAANTKYQHIVLTENKNINEYRLYINGNVQFSSLDEKIYHEQLVEPIMELVKGPKDVLILGGGDGLAVREVKKHKDVKSITLVDLDPGMLKAIQDSKFLTNLNNNAFKNVNIIDPNEYISSGGVKDLNISGQSAGSVNLVNIDADKLLHKLEGRSWDVIIVDFPDPDSIELAKLYSKEFYMKVKRVLRPGGMIVVQSTSPYHAKESYLCIGRTIEAAGFNAIPYHDNVPSFGDWGWYIAFDNRISKTEVLNKIESIDKFSVPTDYLSPDGFKKALVFGKTALIAENKDINTLMYPKLLDLYANNSWLYY